MELNYNESRKIKELKLRVVRLLEQIDNLEKENQKLKCSLDLLTKFLTGEND